MSAPTFDERVDAVIQSYRKALDEARWDDAMGRGLPLAVLIDPGLQDPMVAHSQHLVRLPLSIDAIPTAKRPYLLLLGGATMSERVLNASLRLALEERAGLHDIDGYSPRSVCAWLVPRDLTAPNWQRLATRLARRASLLPPAPEPRVPTTFRFWDPRVTLQLPEALGDKTWSECLLALDLQQWWGMDAEGAMVRVGAAEHFTHGEALAGWQLDAQQWQSMRLISLKARIATAATQWMLPELPGETVLQDVARRAHDLDLRDDADVKVYAYMALTVHERFDAHPQARLVVERWRQDGRPAGGYAAELQSWGDDFLAELAQGDWLHAPASTALNQSNR